MARRTASLGPKPSLVVFVCLAFWFLFLFLFVLFGGFGSGEVARRVPSFGPKPSLVVCSILVFFCSFSILFCLLKIQKRAVSPKNRTFLLVCLVSALLSFCLLLFCHSYFSFLFSFFLSFIVS